MPRSIELNTAIAIHDAGTILLRLQRPIDQQTLDEALLCAIYFGRFEYIDLLIGKGANPDARYEPVERKEVPPLTPEEEAEREARYDAFLKEHGLERKEPPQDEYSKYVRSITHSMNGRASGGDCSTALISASKGTVHMIDSRLIRGEIEYEDSRRPEWLAMGQRWTLAMIDRLLHGGADVNATNSIGHTPLMSAIWSFTWGASLMVEGENNFKEVGRLSPIPTMERLIAGGADLDVQDVAGNTALLLWIESCHAREPHEATAGLRVLLKGGCALDIRSNQGHTALLNAATSRMVPLVRALLDAGATVNIPDKQGFAILHHVVHFGNMRDRKAYPRWLDTVQMLVDAGAEVNAIAPKGRTPLHLAAGGGVGPKLIQLLLDAGAKRDVRDELGLTPYDLAAQKEQDHLFSLLRVSGT